MQNATRDLLGAVLDSESGQRGYLLSHDERYLQPYYAASLKLQALSRALSDLTRDDPEQAKRVLQLQPLIDSKIGENLDRVSARRLPRKRTEPGRTDANIRAARCHFAKQTLRHRTTANVPGTNKKNIFDSAQSTQKVTRSTGQFK